MNPISSVLLASLITLTSAGAADFQPVTLPPGASAPDFSLPGVDGRTHTLNDFADAKLLLVVFTCNHCPTAQYYEDRPIKNLIFASAERDKLIDAFDPGWQGEVPYTLLLAPGGKVVYHETGSITPLALKRAILAALNEQKHW